MNKNQLLRHILIRLEKLQHVATQAALQAYESATDNANIAENKYDTLGLEASYLAQGQANRVEECAHDVAAYRSLSMTLDKPHDTIAIGSLIQLRDALDHTQLLFLGPVAGGQKVVFDNQTVTLITPSSPLGRQLLGKQQYDEIETKVGHKRSSFEIDAIF